MLQTAQRVPPHNVEAEESVLGAMLLNETAISNVLERCRGDDFYRPTHRKIFDAVVGLFGRGEAVDTVTVAEELRRSGVLEEVGGKPYLFHLVSSVPAASNAGHYARIVEETALLRRLIEASQGAAALAYESGDEVDQVVDQIEALIFNVAQRRLGDRFAHIRDLLHDHLEQVEALQLRGSHVTGVPTGFLDMDKLTSGLQRSNLVIVAGRPSFGKCLSADAQIVLRDGSIQTIEQVVQMRQGSLLTLGDDYKLGWTQPAAFVDDGIKPTYKVTTRSGRVVTTTATHPFLTIDGWKPLADLQEGVHVAVPRSIPAFGNDSIGEGRSRLLGYLIGDGGLTGTSPRFTQTNKRVLDDFEEAIADEFPGLSVRPEPVPDRAVTVRIVATVRGQRNALTEWLREIGLMGCGSASKFVPDVIFTAPRAEVAAFLNRLFATDGWASAAGARQIGYATVSERLVRQVQHLLLRFGVIARVRARSVGYKGTRRPAWQLEIIDAASILTFISQIGIFGKEAAVAEVEGVLNRVKRKAVNDVIPREAWTRVDRARAGRSWRSIGIALGLGRKGAGARPHDLGINLRKGTRPIARARMLAFADVLDDLTLEYLAASDIYWDRIQSIEYAGERQVYDLSIPDTHNFVANDVCVHNTSFALNVAQYAATEHQTPVAIFSLEMSKMELVQRLVCAEALVDVHKLRTGNLSDQDWTRLGQAVGRLADAPIYIDDTEAVTVLEIRAKARRLKQKSGLELVVVDYLQLMSGPRRSENRQQEISEISRSLKIMARELDVPVVAVSQLSRAVESRGDKRPMLADLRECVVGDTLVCLADGSRVPIRELVGTAPEVLAVDDSGRMQSAIADKVWKVGTRDVVEVRLASGRRITATKDHRLLGAAGWTRVGELVPGDRLAIARRIPEPESPIEWPDDRVVLLGQLIGDGSYLVHGPLRYTSSSQENLSAVESAARREFGSIVKRYRGRRTWEQLVISGNGNRWHPAGVNLWLRELGIFGQRSHEKRVPRHAFRLSDRQIALLLRHLWATDGTISVRQGRGSHNVVYYTNSVGLADDVCALLVRLGIVARIIRAPQDGYRAMHHVRVSGSQDQRRFLETVGAFGPKMRAATQLDGILRQTASGTNVDTVPAEVGEQVESSMYRRGLSRQQLAGIRGVTAESVWRSFHATQSRSMLAEYAAILGDERLHEWATSDLFWDRVVAIETRGESDVFDLTVPGPSCWVADAVISHNSGALEQDADVVMFIYRDEVYNKESQDRGTAEVILAKHRNGPTGTVKLTFLENYTKFANFSGNLR